MRARGYLVLIVVLFLVPSLGRAQATTYSREALFERAFHSLPFIMTMASLDPTFRKSLTPDEQQAYQSIATIAQDARNRQWLKENRVEIFPAQNIWDTYYHIPFDNKPKRNHTPVRFGLSFSSDALRFQIDGSERAAMTVDSMTDDIFINQRRINDPKSEFSFASVVSLMVHEFGHKLPSIGLTKNQSAINNLGAKLESFVKAKMKTFDSPKGKLTTLNFKSAFFDQWLDRTQQNPTPEPLMIVDEEGIIIFAETSKGCFDLTSEILKPLTEKHLVPGEFFPQYSWGKLNLITADVLQATTLSTGEISFEFNAAHSQTMIPFMKSGAPDPREFNFWKRVSPNSPPYVPNRMERRQSVIDLSGARPRITKRLYRTLKYQDASTDVKKVFVEWQGSDLVAQYKLPTDLKGSWEGGSFSLRPYLIVNLNGKRAEIASNEAYSPTGVFEFRVAGLKSRASGELEIIGMELGVSKENLAVIGESRAQLLLRDRDRLKLDGPGLHSHLAHFDAAKAFVQTVSGNQSLKLSFESTAPLLVLKVLIEYDWTIDAGFNRRSTLKVEKWITLSGSNLKQSYMNGVLMVEANLATIVDETITYDQPGHPKAFAGKVRKLKAVEATNLDLVSNLSLPDDSTAKVCRDLFF